MKAIVFEKYGSPDVLNLKDVPKPTPKDNEVLIRIIASTVTAGDCEIRSFKFPVKWFWLPLRLFFGITGPRKIKVLGQELAGEIEALGKEVTKVSVGDAVFCTTGMGMGAYAEYKCRPEKHVVIKPGKMSFEEASTIPTGGGGGGERASFYSAGETRAGR